MMENEFYKDEFEQLLKEKADQFSMYPSKRVWYSIYNNLHPSRRWPSVVMSLLLISSLSLIGYLNTGDNSLNRPINNNVLKESTAEITTGSQNTVTKKHISSYTQPLQLSATAYASVFNDVITNETDFYPYTVVKSNRPYYFNTVTSTDAAEKNIDKSLNEISGKDLIQTVDNYIKSNQIFADIAVVNKKNKTAITKPTGKNTGAVISSDENTEIATNKTSPLNSIVSTDNTDLSKLTEVNPKTVTKLSDKKITSLTNEEKEWIENYASLNTSLKSRLKNGLAFQFYITPAVNYRKLTTSSKGSTTPFATTGDINNSISQKPGLGIETGLGLTYKVAKKLQLKAGLQFNYTNYNIAADETDHPVITTILLNDPATGYSYSAARTSTTSNAVNSPNLQPITLHNRTYQVSLPVGFAYNLSSQKNVEWFAGASVQPTYFFGGNAHIISSDLKNYVSDPSSIRTWNLNLGFETYMNFKLGSYNFQVGPQVRYQVFSTYRKDIALIEKPYAVGLKFGLTKGF